MQGVLHLFEFAREEVVCLRNDDESFRLRCRGDYLLKSFGWTILIGTAAEEEFGHGAACEKVIAVTATLCLHWQTQRGQAGNTPICVWDVGVPSACAQAHIRAEGEADDEDGQPVTRVEPVKSRANIPLFTAAFVMFALA